MGMPYHLGAAVSPRANQAWQEALKGSRCPWVLGLAYKRLDDLRESPSLSLIEMPAAGGAAVSNNDPFFPTWDEGRKYNLNMRSRQPLDHLAVTIAFDCDGIILSYDFGLIVASRCWVVDSRNATKGPGFEKIVRF